MSRREAAYHRLNLAVSKLETVVNQRLESMGRAEQADREISRLTEERNRLAHDNERIVSGAEAVETRLDDVIERLAKVLEDS